MLFLREKTGEGREYWCGTHDCLPLLLVVYLSECDTARNLGKRSPGPFMVPTVRVSGVVGKNTLADRTAGCQIPGTCVAETGSSVWKFRRALELFEDMWVFQKDSDFYCISALAYGFIEIEVGKSDLSRKGQQDLYDGSCDTNVSVCSCVKTESCVLVCVLVHEVSGAPGGTMTRRVFVCVCLCEEKDGAQWK